MNSPLSNTDSKIQSDILITCWFKMFTILFQLYIMQQIWCIICNITDNPPTQYKGYTSIFSSLLCQKSTQRLISTTGLEKADWLGLLWVVTFVKYLNDEFDTYFELILVPYMFKECSLLTLVGNSLFELCRRGES